MTQPTGRRYSFELDVKINDKLSFVPGELGTYLADALFELDHAGLLFEGLSTPKPGERLLSVAFRQTGYARSAGAPPPSKSKPATTCPIAPSTSASCSPRWKTRLFAWATCCVTPACSRPRLTQRGMRSARRSCGPRPRPSALSNCSPPSHLCSRRTPPTPNLCCETPKWPNRPISRPSPANAVSHRSASNASPVSGATSCG